MSPPSAVAIYTWEEKVIIDWSLQLQKSIENQNNSYIQNLQDFFSDPKSVLDQIFACWSSGVQAPVAIVESAGSIVDQYL